MPAAASATASAQASAPLAAGAAPAASAGPTSSADDTSADKPALYTVYGVAADDVLNVRAEPDAASKKVYSYTPEVKGIRGTGRQLEKANTPWTEVAFEGGTGWVNRAYLLEMPAGGGCNDPNLAAAIRAFMSAVTTSDGTALKAAVSPLRGLQISESQSSPAVRIGVAQVENLFTSSTSQKWGTARDGTTPIVGPFKTIALPSLRRSILAKGAKEKCGQLLVGGSSPSYSWPAQYAKMTMVSFYDASEADRSQWASWVAGMEYVNGKPYVAALVGYSAEI